MPAHKHTASVSNTGGHKHNIALSSSLGDSWGEYNGAVHKGRSNDIQIKSEPVQSAGSHSNTSTIANTGGGQAHNIIQPYLVCYIWERIS